MGIIQTRYFWDVSFDLLQRRVNDWIDTGWSKELTEEKCDDINVKEIRTDTYYDHRKKYMIVWACIIYDLIYDLELE